MREPASRGKLSRVSAASIDGAIAALERDGYVVLENVLSAEEQRALRSELALPLEVDPFGRNDFEGHRTKRVYSLVARGPACAALAEHPRILALCDRVLEPGYLLTASQAIRIDPGETPQALHTDDPFYTLPRPRAPVSVATIWALDDFTKENGATQVIPGSHRWSDEELKNPLAQVDFTTRAGADPGRELADEQTRRLRDRLVDVVMPAGSVVFFLGTLAHRGGENRSRGSRLGLSNQYCQPWARPQENFFLSIPRERARALSERVQQLLGYSIHPPFMGHALGMHPRRFLEER
ncbi:MAG: phytanoyl-CoA dioxygenase family protein [Deltaproteobacteria bacterium]|nr:phytanoyl-CoA dioxygenase family protein [Deltaproteobacteria bacterium]